MILKVTLTLAGLDTGPFNIYSDVDGYVAPFGFNISRDDLLDGVIFYNVPNGTSIVRIISIGDCTNYIDLFLGYSSFTLYVNTVPDIGWTTSELSCKNDGIGITLYTEGGYSSFLTAFNNNVVFYTDSTLTQVFNGDDFWFKTESSSGQGELVQFSSLGIITDYEDVCIYNCECGVDILLLLFDAEVDYDLEQILFTGSIENDGQNCGLTKAGFIYSDSTSNPLDLIYGGTEQVVFIESPFNPSIVIDTSIILCSTIHYRMFVTDDQGLICYSEVKSIEMEGCPEENWYYGTLAVSGGIVTVPNENDIDILVDGTFKPLGAESPIIVPFNSSIDDFLWFATPVVSGLKTAWYVNDFNQGVIGGEVSRLGNLFADPIVVNVLGLDFNLYISNARTNVSSMTMS